ncbi:SLATT domain-containing protein [Methylophilus flavus]|uniref:SLATT domain-containing protein n=1 Tax=Methylophilus flavus TaxID=640084 RepID=A0ABW3PD34_9PROT
MSELDNRLHELLRRTKITTKSRYRASERLELHHKLSQWTVSLISVALVFIPLVQTFRISAGIEVIYLNATQATLAILVLVYSLLLGQENFISRAQAMHRNGVELGRFARKLAGMGQSVSDEEYFSLAEEYYDILEKYENHKPIDYLYTRLSENPSNFNEWAIFIGLWLKARVMSLIVFSHYFVAIGFVGFIFYTLFSGIVAHAK